MLFLESMVQKPNFLKSADSDKFSFNAILLMEDPELAEKEERNKNRILTFASTELDFRFTASFRLNRFSIPELL